MIINHMWSVYFGMIRSWQVSQAKIIYLSHCFFSQTKMCRKQTHLKKKKKALKQNSVKISVLCMKIQLISCLSLLTQTINIEEQNLLSTNKLFKHICKIVVVGIFAYKLEQFNILTSCIYQSGWRSQLCWLIRMSQMPHNLTGSSLLPLLPCSRKESDNSKS